MFARVTHFQMKPDSIADAKRLTDELEPKIMALPGLRQFINCINDDGSGCVISIVESRETSDGNAEAVQALWANFTQHLTAPPKAEGFEIYADWTK